MISKIKSFAKNVVSKCNKAHLALALFGMLAAFNPEMASAGTGGTEFDGITTTLTGWLEGGLGKMIAIIGLIVAVGYCAIDFSIKRVGNVLAVILIASVGTGLISGFFTALI